MTVPSNLEWSLPVPSVQELASRPLERVPHRYVRADVDDPVINPCNPSVQIPLIDAAKLISGEPQKTELHNLQLACKDWGAFQLINHGISDDLIQKMRDQFKGFFDLPLHEKQVYAQKPGSLEGYGQAFVISEEQKLEWCDMIFLKTLPARNRILDFWPSYPQQFRETLENYSQELRRVTVSLLGFMGMAIGLDALQFSQAFEDGQYHVRMNCYPPCPQPELAIGISPHADNSGVTLLLEGGNTPGLQFRKDGFWVPVKPIDGALVVNIGHIIEIMSNGIYKSAEHRAITNKENVRFSAVTFCYSSEDSQVGPLLDLITSDNPTMYQTLSHAEYFHRFHNQKLDGTKFIDSLKINAEL